MIIEVLLYSITALIIINAVAVVAAVWVAFESGQVEKLKRQYWQVKIEKVRREASER